MCLELHYKTEKTTFINADIRNSNTESCKRYSSKKTTYLTVRLPTYKDNRKLWPIYTHSNEKLIHFTEQLPCPLVWVVAGPPGGAAGGGCACC